MLIFFCKNSIEKLEYKCTTRILPLCNGTIIVLNITLLHSVSVTADERLTIPTILGMLIEEVRAIIAPL